MPSAGGIVPLLLQLTVRLAQNAYDGPTSFSNMTGTLLYYTTVCQVHQPLIYVYQQDGSLYIITRGSTDAPDFATDTEFGELELEYGVFHGGFALAGQWVWSQVEEYVKNFDGPIYFTGHSYGAAVSGILHVIAHKLYPQKEFYSYAYAPMPAMEVDAAAETKSNMYGFVNDDDIIPTLSIPNCFERVKLLSPLISIIPTSWLVGQIRGVLNLVSLTSVLDDEYYQMLYDAIPGIIDAAKAYEKGEAKYVRFVVGQIYQIDSEEPKVLTDCLIDPQEILACLSLTFECITHHHCDLYMKAINELIWP